MTEPITIARPDVPAHFMVLRPVNRRVIVRMPDGPVLAETSGAVRVIESGKSIYDPVLYIPSEDTADCLEREEHTTHCPLKGDASYFSCHGVQNIAWSYENPLDFSVALKGLVAFYGEKVVIEEHPL